MQINNTIFNIDLQSILDELQSQLRINGINLIQKVPRRSGNSLQIQCPYHANGQERKPSAGIRDSDGMFHCFTCGEIHTLPEVISHCFGHNDLGIFGWNWLLKNFLTVEIEQRKEIQLDYERKGSNKNRVGNDDSNSDFYISEEELDSYRYYHKYWEKRKIVDEDIIELFDLGYDKKTHCITFPVRDIEGNCLFVARRSVRTKFFSYPQGAEKPLYGLYELELSFPDCNKRWPDIIITESMIDALTCWQYGKYAVALNGLGNDLQFKQLRQLPCRKLILATDNDEAGMRARKRIRKNITNKLITEYEFPADKKDINELSELEFNRLKEVF